MRSCYIVSKSDEVPVSVLEISPKKRAELIEQLAEVDDGITDLMIVSLKFSWAPR